MYLPRDDRSDVERWSAFATGGSGGNPAGIWIGDELPSAARMKQIAAAVGYSETAFLAALDEPGRWRVRYFSPRIEVDFCGHATIAAGVALGYRHGDGLHHFETAAGVIPVEVRIDGTSTTASLTSVEPTRRACSPDLVARILATTDWTHNHLDPQLRPDIAFAGAWHLVLPIRSRGDLARLDYEFDELAALMHAEQLTTIQAVWREHDHSFHSRNPFPVGGVVEDPATGAAAAALGSYLRFHHHLEPPSDLTVTQGTDMGQPSRIDVHIPRRGGIQVTGTAHRLRTS